MELNSKSKIKENKSLFPASNFIRFLAVPFGLLLCYGACQKLSMTNMSFSIDNWGMLISGILLAAAPFLMNRFLSIILLGMGVFTVVNLLTPNAQSWINLILFISVTLLLFKPYKIWLRILIQLAIIGLIVICLWYVYQDFYKGIEHFVVTGKLTDEYLSNRIRNYLPGDFSYYMAVLFINISIRQHIPIKRKNRNTDNIIKNDNYNDNDLWGY